MVGVGPARQPQEPWISGACFIVFIVSDEYMYNISIYIYINNNNNNNNSNNNNSNFNNDNNDNNDNNNNDNNDNNDNDNNDNNNIYYTHITAFCIHITYLLNIST